MAYFRKSLLICLYLLLHFFVLREVRTEFFQFQIQEIQNYSKGDHSDIKVKRIDARIFDLNYSKGENLTDKVWTYKVPFGFFFLLGIVGLIWVGSDKKFYWTLMTIHFLVLLLASLVFYLAINLNTWLLAINDLLTRYFIPVISISVIAFALLEKNSKIYEREIEVSGSDTE